LIVASLKSIVGLRQRSRFAHYYKGLCFGGWPTEQKTTKFFEKCRYAFDGKKCWAV